MPLRLPRRGAVAHLALRRREQHGACSLDHLVVVLHALPLLVRHATHGSVRLGSKSHSKEIPAGPLGRWPESEVLGTASLRHGIVTGVRGTASATARRVGPYRRRRRPPRQSRLHGKGADRAWVSRNIPISFTLAPRAEQFYMAVHSNSISPPAAFRLPQRRPSAAACIRCLQVQNRSIWTD
jgi:hypothetical protein